jgi:hypothetical protein
VHAPGWQLLEPVQEAGRPANDRNRPGIEQALPVIKRPDKKALVVKRGPALRRIKPGYLDGRRSVAHTSTYCWMNPDREAAFAAPEHP